MRLINTTQKNPKQIWGACQQRGQGRLLGNEANTEVRRPDKGVEQQIRPYKLHPDSNDTTAQNQH